MGAEFLKSIYSKRKEKKVGRREQTGGAEASNVGNSYKVAISALPRLGQSFTMAGTPFFSWLP